MKASEMKRRVVRKLAENGFLIYPIALDLFIRRWAQNHTKIYDEFIDYFCGWLELKRVWWITPKDVERFFTELRKGFV